MREWDLENREMRKKKVNVAYENTVHKAKCFRKRITNFLCA
jgi:hypothetical protein